MVLSVEIVNFNGHDDLLLKSDILKINQQADTYYFIIDNDFMSGDESFAKVVSTLKILLNDWVKQIEELTTGVTYLPFDFSDEYIGCLKVEYIENDKLLLSYGYTAQYKGWSIYPSDTKDFKLKSSDYSTETVPVPVSKTDTINSIHLSIAKLEQGL